MKSEKQNSAEAQPLVYYGTDSKNDQEHPQP